MRTVEKLLYHLSKGNRLDSQLLAGRVRRRVLVLSMQKYGLPWTAFTSLLTELATTGFQVDRVAYELNLQDSLDKETL